MVNAKLTNAGQASTINELRPIHNWGKRAILVMSDCGSSPVLANLISGHLAGIGIKHGYLCYDRSAYAVANGFGRLGFKCGAELVELCQPQQLLFKEAIVELAQEREWGAIVVDNINIAVWQTRIGRDELIQSLDQAARELEIPIFCIANKPRKVEIE